MDQKERLQMFRDMISCSHYVPYWCYDADGNVLESDSVPHVVFHKAFIRARGPEYIRSAPGHGPIILSSEQDILWFAVREFRDGALYRFHLGGPIYTSNVSHKQILRIMNNIALEDASPWLKSRIIDDNMTIPVLSESTVCQYALMLHYCVTGEKLGREDLHFQNSGEAWQAKSTADINQYMSAYQSERAVLRAVREGESIKTAMESLQNWANSGGPEHYTGDALLDYKLTAVILTSLCMRACVEGGVFPDKCFIIGNRYIKKICAAAKLSEVAMLRDEMYQYYVNEVRACRKNTNYSAKIQTCCDYIEAHGEEPLDIDSVAAHFGYTKYYLARCFKNEVGVSLNEYIRITKIERAKALLENSSLDTESIVERVSFRSRSSFYDCFKQQTGMTPAQYRASFRSQGI